MPNLYAVTIESIKEVHSLPGSWENDALRELLALAEVDDLGEIADADLLDMVLMVLQDLGNQKAGELVLEAVFGDAMRPGVRQNLVADLQEDEPWTDFAEVSQQRGIFVAVCLLQKAFPRRYGTPDALQLRVKVTAQSSAGAPPMQAPQADWLIRLLACGMSEHNIVHRLYADELKAGKFKEADGLIWDCQAVDADSDNSRTFDLTAAAQLFNSLSPGQAFKASVI